VAGVQNRAGRAERALQAHQLHDAAASQADRAQRAALTVADQSARRLMDHALDRQWLDQASVLDVARVWRTAAMHAASGDQRAGQVLRRVHEQLRSLNPELIDAYERHRAAGLTVATAMQATIHTVWATQPPGAGHSSGPVVDPFGDELRDELDAEIRAEIARLAIDVDPGLLDRVQRQWRSVGHAPAADAAALLAQFARDLRGLAPTSVVDEVHAAARRAATHTSTPATSPAPSPDHVEPVGPDDAAHATRDSQKRPRPGADQTAAAAKGADQRQRMGRAFPPLRRVDPAARPASSTVAGNQRTNVRRRGTSR
jgi:hypothetical protein